MGLGPDSVPLPSPPEPLPESLPESGTSFELARPKPGKRNRFWKRLLVAALLVSVPLLVLRFQVPGQYQRLVAKSQVVLADLKGRVQGRAQPAKSQPTEAEADTAEAEAPPLPKAIEDADPSTPLPSSSAKAVLEAANADGEPTSEADATSADEPAEVVEAKALAQPAPKRRAPVRRKPRPKAKSAELKEPDYGI
jgi:hypothetical protein